MFKTMFKDEDGYIVVETVGTFVPFVLLVISILSLVNIVTMQARVHYALTQTACTLSMYSYVLKATGASDSLMAMDSRESITEDNISSVLDIIQNFANLGLGKLQSKAVGELAEPFFKRYLAVENMSADEYLNLVRVVNFEFGNCVLIDKNGNVKLTVDYEIEYTFGILRFPFRPTLKVTQTAVTKAWTGGSGEGYW